MKEAKEIAAELSKGNVDKAREVRDRLFREQKGAFELEIMEIAKQAIIFNLKNGKIRTAKEIKKSFGLSEELVEDTVQQAVLSSFCDGDVERVKELTDDLPIPQELRMKIVEYCASWNRKEMTALMQEVFA